MLPVVVVVGFLGCSEGTTEPEPNEADAALFQASANPGYLEITPLEHDFGEVEIGSNVTAFISLMNVNGHAITVYSFEFQAGSDADFSLGDVPDTPLAIFPGEMAEVEVVFSPSAAGYVSAVLEIESDDPVSPLQEVVLAGVGVSAQPSPMSVQDILDFFDASVEAGTLDGRGQRPQSKKAQLRVFRFRLVAASTLIEAGHDGLACHRLERAYLRSDGQTPPPDFLVGDATAELNTMILQLMVDMGCELPW
jgi:hypothetical protein